MKLGTVAAKHGKNFLGKMLGTVAGPVGAGMDIYFNIHSITQQAEILINPSVTRFDRADAISNIVASSIDIGITAVAAVVGTVFPPLKPLVDLAAFAINLLVTVVVEIFQAWNHVERLNSELPLLSFEKVDQFVRKATGSITSPYIEDLISVKRANNIAVNVSVQKLEFYRDWAGHVFPSRTLDAPHGDCYVQQKSCTKFLVFFSLGNIY